MRLVIALSAILALPFATTAAAQQLLASYTAFIGPEDLRNSRGERLREPWQVLRQDRANFHRFGIRQFADDYDPIFASADARAQFESLVRNGRIDPAARAILVHGGAIVHVQVYGRGRQLQRVEVQVSR
jgi:hypothetical protein